MSASIAFDGYGVTFGVGDGSSSESFTDVAEVLSASLPSFSKDTIDVTHASSPSKFREFIAGLRDAGEVTLEMNFTQSDYASFLAAFDSDGLNNYKVTIPDDNYSTKPNIVFAGIITGIETEISVEDKVQASVTFKLSGKPTYSQGS